MVRIFLMVIAFISSVFIIKAQEIKSNNPNVGLVPNIGIEHSSYLIEGLYASGIRLSNGFALYYNKPFFRGKHQIEISPRIAGVFIPDIQNKYFLGVNVNYKYTAFNGFETRLYIGLHYVLTYLAFDRHEYENNVFVNKGRYLHGIAPTVGGTIGYKFFRDRKYSVAPYLGFCLTKIDKQYTPDFFGGYKPNVSIGLTFYNKGH